jgi:hypothetical protein
LWLLFGVCFAGVLLQKEVLKNFAKFYSMMNITIKHWIQDNEEKTQ